MILISRRKTSPGTSLIGEAVNKVTCSRTRPAGSSGRGLRVAEQAGQGSRVPRRGVSRRGQGTLCLLSSGWRPSRRVGLRSLAFFLPSLLFSSWGYPLALLRPLPPPSPQSGAFPFPSKCPQAHPPSAPASQPQVQHAVRVTHHLLAPGYFTHQRGHGWMGIAQRSPLEATCRGHPGAFKQPDSSI